MLILKTWFSLPAATLFASLAALLSVNAVVLYLLVFRTKLGRWLQTCSGVVAPFFGSVAILFSLLTGFLANDVWERNRQAARSVLAESDDVRALQGLSIASASDMADIRTALRTYVRAVVVDEWPSMAHREASPEAEQALAALLEQVSRPSVTAEAGAPVHGALLAAVMRLGSVRHDRLLLSGDQSDELKWASVILLALFTQVAIASVHLERSRAFVLSLCIFSTAAGVTLGLIAMREQPFTNPQLSAPSELLAWLKETS